MKFFRKFSKAISGASSASGQQPPVEPAQQPAAPVSILDSYIKTAPVAQNAVDIFAGEWSSMLPEPYQNIRAGSTPLFADGRVAWMKEQVGDLSGMSALDLGPLEGGHAYMLEGYGVKYILAIEANTRAYLRCLIVKEMLGMKHTHFQCGDFVEYLRRTDRTFDLVVASGVLYHMTNPVELLGLLGKHCTGHLYLWTHYYEDALIKNPKVRQHFGEPRTLAYEGFETTVYHYAYRDTLDVSGFCGGSNAFSCWMTRQGIVDALKYYGFRRVTIGIDHLDHPHGPSFAIVASKSETSG